MGRPHRLDAAGTWHHVFNRGADRQDIFSTPTDHRRFEALLGDAVDARLIEVHALCAMTNHFHLLVRSPEGRMSEAMHLVASEYVRWYNDCHGRDGPLFRSRFKSKMVESDDQLVTVSRYIHRNPLAIVDRTALLDYPWSSYGAYCGVEPAPPWLTTTDVMSVWGQSRERYRAFVEQTVPSDAETAPRDHVRLAELERAVSSVTDGCVTATRAAADAASRRRREMVIALAVELRVADSAALAATFGLSGPAAARVIARRGRVRVHDDEAFAAVRRGVLRRLTG